jgi:RND family efflux transporter MFP subunit
MARYITISSELVPFQEIDVYAKESGFVSKLYVDYGSHVKKGQLLAVLEIPELQALLQEDQSTIKSMADQVTDAEHELGRIEAQHNVAHLQYDRLNHVAKSKPGLVAQQEVDDAQGKDLAAEAQVEAAKSRLQVAQSQFAVSQSKMAHDQALYDYSKITAPFAGVVTQRYANFGTLMQAGTNSTQALPLVKLSQEDLFRLVIPVPESYVRYIKTDDPVTVRVPALNRDFPGKIARFSVDVTDSTRTMHTEVDVPNPKGLLIPGVYAEVTLALDRKGDALVIPLQAINQGTDNASVLVVDAGNKIQDRQVTLGIQTENNAEVLSGLREGDQVVISDRSGLRPGEAVQPKLTQVASYNSQS